ncbi:hypothetical protein HDC91_001298 [Mucilaginibacter sp. AK015]|nr:hypothetical protein [Mucilaginibacter sp. AK015]
MGLSEWFCTQAGKGRYDLFTEKSVNRIALIKPNVFKVESQLV